MSYYSTTILNESPPPQAYWRMGVASGSTVPDATGNGYTGTLTGAITYGVAGAISGDSDTSLGFTGSDFFALPYTLNPSAWSALSLEFWIKQTVGWEHVVVTVNSTTTTTYLDGAAYVSGSGDPVLINQSIYWAGSYNSGNLDEIAIYNYGLSPAQVQKHFLIGQFILNGGFTCWANGTGTASFDHFRTTQYPDPALSLAPVIPRLGTSLAQWNANTLSSSTLGVDVSSDGVNWTDMSAGAAMIFDGATGYISIPTGSVTAGANCSFEVWFNVANFANDGSNIGRRIVLVNLDGTNAFQLGLNGTNNSIVWACNDGTGQVATSSTGFAAGTTYHVVGAWNASTRTPLLYVNGVLQPNNGGALSFGLGTASTSNIGRRTDGLGYFSGTIDEVLIYAGTALTAQQILNNYNAGIGLTTATYSATVLALNPVRYYKLGDIGTTVVDNGSQAQNGSTQGTITENVPGLLTSRSGQQITPLYYNQPDPTIDGFSVNSSANYTSTNRTGGAVATWTFDTANSRLVATGGTNGIYTYNAISRADVDFFTDLDRSDAGGLVWRFNDASDFYYLLIADTQASSGTPNTMTLYRVASNVQAQLAQATLTTTYGTATGASTMLFYRGTYHRFRVTMLGNVITCSFDGTQLISYTDGSPIATAGTMGLFNNGGTTGSRYYQLWIQPQGDLVTGTPAGDIVTGQFVYTRARLASTDPTTTPQLLDMTTMAAGPNIRNGVQLANLAYSSTYIGKAYDDNAKASNYSWYVGVDSSGNKTIYFRPPQAVPSPWILQSTPNGIPSDMEHDQNHAVETASNTMYRNRQILTGVIGQSAFSDSFAGDGKKTSFTLRYPVAAGTVPTITKNTVPQTVGLKGTSGSQWYYAYGDPVIAQDTSGTVLQSIDTLSVNYQGTYTTSVTVDNLAAQSALAAISKDTGIVELVEDVSKLQLNVAAATTYANQLLLRYGITGRSITFKTYRPGLEVLQILTAFVPEYNLVGAELLVLSIDISMQTQPNNTVLYAYVVNCSELPYIKSWPALLSNNLLLSS